MSHPAVELSSKKRSLIFINVNISMFSGTMLTTALTTALPPIMKEFHVDVSTAQWLTSGFTLTMSIIIPLTSFLMNHFKTKKLFLTAIFFFLVGLTIALFSVNFPMLLTGRIVQAFGSGLMSSLAQTIILTIYPPAERGYAMGWFGLSLGAAPIIAPTISGVLVDSVGWRMIFVLAMAIMIMCLIYTIIIFDDVLPNRESHFDFISFVLSALAFGGVTLAIGNFGDYEFVSYQVTGTFIVGIITGLIFAIRQLHVTIPFLDIRVFKHTEFALGVITTGIIQLILNGSAVIFPIYFQTVMGYSATMSGIAILPGSLALSVISPYAGKLYDKMGIKPLFLFAGIVSSISNLALFFVNINTDIWVVSTINIARCLAMGVITMPVITWGMKGVPEHKTADGTATQNAFRILSMSIGTALFVSIMSMVSDTVKETNPYPDLFGIKVVFLCMAIISVIILLFGIFANEHNFISLPDDDNSEFGESSTSDSFGGLIKEGKEKRKEKEKKREKEKGNEKGKGKDDDVRDVEIVIGESS
ncbi:MFS general substrate transporter [Piromyces finnis]|uniref:MFS general substrate transporter n=1 Tax=Piromyces finnis TaxID=1754191 RepID=A0A1Y1VJL4_9FUNG|nr:MFS general substrate transporter [Piromyces finnis]|eukprot:ORX57899.1 MFS general substrate transporter [Piromyces finnis]